MNEHVVGDKNDYYQCETRDGFLVVLVPLRKFECVICGVVEVCKAPDKVDRCQPLWVIGAWLPDWKQVHVPAEGSLMLCPTCSTPLFEAERIAAEIKNEAERNLSDRIAVLRGHPPKEDRKANEAFAKSRGLNWRSCVRCGQKYGSHEANGDPIQCLQSARTSHLTCCARLSTDDDAKACVRIHQANQ